MRGNEKGERQRSRKKEVMKEKERNEDRERVVVYKYMSIEWVHSGRKEERRKRGIREVCRRDHSFPTFLFSFPSISPHHSVSLRSIHIKNQSIRVTWWKYWPEYEVSWLDIGMFGVSKPPNQKRGDWNSSRNFEDFCPSHQHNFFLFHFYKFFFSLENLVCSFHSPCDSVFWY